MGIGSFFKKIGSVLTSTKTDQALNAVGKAMPFISMVASIAIAGTPTNADDAAWATVKGKYPNLFDGTSKTADEMKLAAFAAAADMLAHKYPGLSTSVARAAVQLAYLQLKK